MGVTAPSPLDFALVPLINRHARRRQFPALLLMLGHMSPVSLYSIKPRLLNQKEERTRE